MHSLLPLPLRVHRHFPRYAHLIFFRMQPQVRERTLELFSAVETGDAPAVETLLRESEADPQACASYALAWAIRSRSADVLRVLIRDGRAQLADVHADVIETLAATDVPDDFKALLNDVVYAH